MPPFGKSTKSSKQSLKKEFNMLQINPIPQTNQSKVEKDENDEDAFLDAHKTTSH